MHTYTHTRTQPLYRPLLLHYPEEALSASLFAFKTPSPIHRAPEGTRLVRTGCLAQATRVWRALHMLPSPVFSTSWIGVNSQQNTALSGVLPVLPQSLFTQLSAGWLQEADFHLRTQSVLPAHHGPCSKAGKTLQNPHRAPHAHLRLAGGSGWAGNGRDPRLNLSCYSVCEY